MKVNFYAILRILLRMFAVIVITVCVVLYFGQDRIIFHPRQYGANAAFQLERYEKLAFETAKDGPQLAYYLGPKGKPPEKLWILTGGNGSLALGWDFLATPVFRKNPNMGCLLIEYPGYGVNSGKPSRTGIQQVMAGAVTTLAAHLKADEATLKSRSSFLGHSLGAAVALETAAEWKRPEIIALAPFTSMKDMASKTVGSLLANLTRHRWDNRAAISAITEQENADIFIHHGKDDQIVPVAMGKELSEIAPEKIIFMEYPSLGHNDIGVELREQLVARMIR